MRRTEHRENESEEFSEAESPYRDLISLLMSILRDFLPILMERWTEFSDRPTLKAIEDENRRLRDRLEQVEKKLQWLTLFQVVMALFFLFLVVLLALRVI